MQITSEKGLVTRDESDRSRVYEAAVGREQTQRQAVSHLLDRLFSGSPHKLVMQALASKKATCAERSEIRKLLDELEAGRQMNIFWRMLESSPTQ